MRFELPVAGPTTDRRVATTPEIDALLATDAPVAIGVSGGKDSTAVAFAVVEHLDRIGHTGPRLLIHADLGVTEWADSLPTCRRLADRLGLELVVVKRPQGDMMDRWEQRWNDNVRRWETLSCVKLILPWSTPSMRFCTAELKIDQICRYLSNRFPGQQIVSVTGIRREESDERANAPVAKEQPKLESTTRRTSGWTWNAIADFTIGDVVEIHHERSFDPHEAYVVFDADRVSCVYCMIATEKNHRDAARDPRNHEVGRRQVRLEVASTFAFQGSRWLGDTLADLLTPAVRAALVEAKDRAGRREVAEAKIPKHLLYTKNWPTCVPTEDEALLLAAVRFQVADAVGLRQTFIRPTEIIARYRELLAEKGRRDRRKASRKTRARKLIAA